MADKTMDVMLKQTMQLDKRDIAQAFVKSCDRMANLCVVLESYIGRENVKKLVVDGVTDELIKSMMKGARA